MRQWIVYLLVVFAGVVLVASYVLKRESSSSQIQTQSQSSQDSQPPQHAVEREAKRSTPPLEIASIPQPESENSS